MKSPRMMTDNEIREALPAGDIEIRTEAMRRTIIRHDPEVVCRLLEVLAGSEHSRANKHDIILNAAIELIRSKS